MTNAQLESTNAALNPAEYAGGEAAIDSAGDELTTETYEESASGAESEDAAYEPPFPDRTDLFVAPKREHRGANLSPDGLESSIELLGFVNVDGQRVVLSIDGLVSPLTEGSVEAGIEVISIQPPAVVLQRGRQRWQATLEN